MPTGSFMSHGKAEKSFRFLKNRELYRRGAREVQERLWVGLGQQSGDP